MKQGLLAFQYEEEKSTTGMTALSGLMTYVELMHVAGLRSSVERRVGLRGGGQGWTDSQIITSLILLNLAGGESVMTWRSWRRTQVCAGYFDMPRPMGCVAGSAGR